jgi:hypothetical protein
MEQQEVGRWVAWEFQAPLSWDIHDITQQLGYVDPIISIVLVYIYKYIICIHL